jgi:3-isopropylmalate/(R)-2-methylmalate dehydratase large subunit
MIPFHFTTSKITPIAIKDIDTDMIIPAQYLTQTGTTGFGQYLFERLRKTIPDFPLNQAKHQANTILVARDNFGCGSSREHAVWSLLQYGFRVIIAPSFSDIFSNNAPKNGLVLVKLDPEIVEELLTFEGEVTVNLEEQTVDFGGKKHEFYFDQFRKDCILNGYDDMDYLLSYSAQIDAWNKQNSNLPVSLQGMYPQDGGYNGYSQNIIQKIWQKHTVVQKEGHPTVFGIDLQLVHEVTSPQAFSVLRSRNLPVKYPSKHIATLDHSIPTRQDRENIHDPVAKIQVETLRQNVVYFGVQIKDFGSGNQGIVHVMAPEIGLVQPGMTIVCGDSHTSTHGAFGAMAFGVGTSEVGLVMATGCILQKEPKTMKVEFVGKLPRGCYSKDMILKLISVIGIGGGNGHIVEFCGLAIKDLSMEARMSLCNMSIEAGARAGLVAPDETTFEYLEAKLNLSKDEFQAKKEYWSSFISEPNCSYDKSVVIDISDLEPQISWGTNPSETIGITQNIPSEQDVPQSQKNNYHNSLQYTKLTGGQKLLGQTIDWVFIGSCTNARLEDLKIVANILCPDGVFENTKKIAPNIKCYIVPGSEAVKAEAEKLGLDQIFKTSGAEWRMPGCSMCLGMNDDKVPAGARCVSTSNRNFMNRQGVGAITHLVSPATAIWSAINGKVSDVRELILTTQKK